MDRAPLQAAPSPAGGLPTLPRPQARRHLRGESSQPCLDRDGLPRVRTALRCIWSLPAREKAAKQMCTHWVPGSRSTQIMGFPVGHMDPQGVGTVSPAALQILTAQETNRCLVSSSMHRQHQRGSLSPYLSFPPTATPFSFSDSNPIPPSGRRGRFPLLTPRSVVLTGTQQRPGPCVNGKISWFTEPGSRRLITLLNLATPG